MAFCSVFSFCLLLKGDKQLFAKPNAFGSEQERKTERAAKQMKASASTNGSVMFASRDPFKVENLATLPTASFPVARIIPRNFFLFYCQLNFPSFLISVKTILQCSNFVLACEFCFCDVQLVFVVGC